MPVRFFKIGSSCSPSSVRALPGAFGLLAPASPPAVSPLSAAVVSVVAVPMAAPADGSLSRLVARVWEEAVGVVAESRPAKRASQSWEEDGDDADSAGPAAVVFVWFIAGVLGPAPAPAPVGPVAVAVDADAAGVALAPAVLPAAEVPDKEPKSKLLSVPNEVVLVPPPRPAPVCVASLLAWLGGGELSKTGLKSSRPEREMVAKSSSAEPSLASSRPSKSSSRSSKGAGDLAGAGAAVGAAGVEEEPKMSLMLEELRLLRCEGEVAVLSLWLLAILLFFVKN